MTKQQKILSTLRLYVCPCHLCTAKRVTEEIRKIEKRIMLEVNFGRNGRVLNVSNVDELTMAAILVANGGINASVSKMLELYFKAYVRMVKLLRQEPFLSFDDLMDFPEFAFLQISPSLLRYFKHLFVRTQPRCYQIYALENDKRKLVFQQPPVSREDLVGIEHNPGPMSIWLIVLNLMFGINLWDHFLIAGVTSTGFPQRAISIQICWSIALITLICKVLILFDRETLVGIEHNPGPEKMIIKYLKNMEKIDDFASTRKRSSKISNVLKSIEKKNQKTKDQLLNEKRRMKNSNFLPEGLFDSTIKLEESSKAFLEDVVDRLLSNTMNIDVSHHIDIPFQHKVSSALQGLQSLGKKIWNLIVAFLKLVLSFLHPVVSDFILPFLESEEEVWFDANEYQTEGGVSWEILTDNIYAKHLKDVVQRRDWSSFCRLTELLKGIYFKQSPLVFYQKLAEETANFLYEIFGVKIPFLYKEDLLMKELFAEAKSLYDQYSTGQIDDYAFADRVMIFVNELENHLYEKRQTVSPQQKEKLTHLLRKFQPVMQYCMRYVNPNNGPRVEPLAILIAGPTGVGKSTITVPFLLALMSRILPEDKKEQFMKNHNDFLFFRANENEFWDGYKMRNVAVVYDDFGQMKDAVGAPSADAFEMIRLKNTAPYHLHFAALEDKQRNYATPKLIFATTNLSKLWFNGLTCSEAVSRRFDLCYVQVPRAEFSKDNLDTEPWSRRLDVDKIREKYPLDLNDPASYVPLDVVEFIPWNFTLGQQRDGPILSFWELLDACESKFKEVSTSGDRMLKFHRFLKENPRPVPQMNSKFNWDYVKTTLFNGIKGMVDIPTFYDSRVAISDKAKLVLSGLLGAASIALAFRLTSGSDAGMNLQSSNSKVEAKDKKIKTNLKSRARAVKRTNRAIRPPHGMISAQSGDTQLNSYLKLLKRNMYKLGSRGSENDFGWALFLFDRTFLIPRHFLLTLDSEVYEAASENRIVTVSFKNPFTGNCAIVVDWQNDVSLYDYALPSATGSLVDYVFMTIRESKCRVHADITDMFVHDKNFRDGERFKAQMAVQRAGEVLFLLPEVCILKSAMEYGSQVHSEEGEVMVHTNTISYSAPTEFGDCGSVILSIDPRFQRPTIVGIHTAGHRNQRGNQKLALGTYIEREHIDKLRQQLPTILKKELLEVDDVKMEGFTGLRAATQPRIPFQTKIQKSVLSEDLWETTTKPAYLRPFTTPTGEEKDPRKIARDGYCHSEVYIDSDTLDRSHVLVNELVLRQVHTAPWAPRIFSFEEAVLGIPGVEYVESINRSTSPGYPYVLENRSKGKTAWFGNDQDLNLQLPKALELRKRVEEVLVLAKCGVRSEHIFVDYLKDERRPISKVEEGKTRQFMACGMDFLICVKMYFGDFIRSICQNRIQNGIAVGVNPFSEWDTLVSYMKDTKTKRFTAGDYSKFDARIPVAIAYAVLDTVEQFYYNSTDEDRLVRQILWLEIVNSLHISQGVVYEFCGGNPSGQPMTSIFNSIANLEMLAYLGLNNQLRYQPHTDYDLVFKRTRFSVFGDDNIISYEPSDKDIFGQVNLERHAFEDLGMTYTNESKDSNVVQDREIEQISFLKRGFRQDHGIWMCPLQIDVLRETLSWERQGSTESEMKLRAEAVLAEFARHGKPVFATETPRIVRAMQKHYKYACKNANYHLAVEDGNGLQYI